MGSCLSFLTMGPAELMIGEYLSLCFVVYLSANYFTSAIQEHKVITKAKTRRRERDAKKFTFPPVKEEKVKKILEAADVTTLREMQIRGEVTSVEIVSVFAQRAHTIGRKFNYVTEEYYNEAFEEARLRDAETQKAIKEKKV
jgi:hypothetical protein